MPLAVQGLRSFLQATDRAGRATKRLTREGLAEAAEPVRLEAQRLFNPYSTYSAKAYYISIRRAGWVYLQSRLRKTTGKHPEWGALQMSEAFVPAADSGEEMVARGLALQFDKIADQFNRL